jgi:hypothetical protein
MLKPLLVIVAVCLVCGVAWGDGKGIVITDPAFSVSMVQGVSDPGTGLCASYKVVSWKDAGLWVDGGALFRENLDDANPFVGLSTNIKPLNDLTKAILSLDTRWGVGYQESGLFGYVAAGVNF